MVTLTEHTGLSRETVRRRLAENHLKPWRKDMWCIPQVDGNYVAGMQDVLDLCAEAPDPKRPWCASTRARSSSSARCVNLSRPGQGSSSASISATAPSSSTPTAPRARSSHRATHSARLRPGHARACRRALSQSRAIRVVLDNLSTHSPGALYEAFPACEAHRLPRRREFHYTPKHVSWLNMVEIEIGVLRGQCLDRRIADRELLVAKIAARARQAT
jgi:hypothetical protein